MLCTQDRKKRLSLLNLLLFFLYYGRGRRGQITPTTYFCAISKHDLMSSLADSLTIEQLLPPKPYMNGLRVGYICTESQAKLWLLTLSLEHDRLFSLLYAVPGSKSNPSSKRGCLPLCMRTGLRQISRRFGISPIFSQ